MGDNLKTVKYEFLLSINLIISILITRRYIPEETFPQKSTLFMKGTSTDTILIQ